MAVAKAKAKAKALPLVWSNDRRAAFLDALALSPNVAAAERKAGMPEGSAYKERRRSAEFAGAWAEALADGYSRLEMVLLERALTGVAKRTTRRGETTTVTDYSDRLGMALLAAHRATVAARRPGPAPIDAETARERLARKIEDMSRRMADG